MRSSLVLCALLSAASGLTLRPCGRPTSRRAMLAGSLCAVVLPSFAEDAPGLAAPAAPAAPPQMYQNGLVAPELAPAPVAAAPTLAEPTEITRAARHRTEPRTAPRTEPRTKLRRSLASGGSPLCSHAVCRYSALTQKITECMSGVCDVDKVEFTSSNGDEGFATVRGRRLPIRGIPPENPNSGPPR